MPAGYCHLNLDVTKANLLAAGFSAVPVVFLVLYMYFVISDKVTNFGTLAQYNSEFLVVFGLVAFLAQLQLLHLLRYNATIAMLGTMLKKSVADMLAYALIGGIIFIAFSSVAALTLWTMRDYSTFGQVNYLY